MSQAAIPFQHPLQRCAAAAAAAVGEAAESSPIYLSTEAKAEVLVSLSTAIARLEGLRLAVVAAAGEVAEEDGARSAVAWVAHRARLERPEGRRLQTLAEALDERDPVLAAALVAGKVSRPQAEVIATASRSSPPTSSSVCEGRPNGTWWSRPLSSDHGSYGSWAAGCWR